MIEVLKDASAFNKEAVRLIVNSAKKNMEEKGSFSLVLSGGETPRSIYELLAATEFRDQIDWQRVSVFFGDERYVPSDSDQSNYRLAYETLLKNVPIPEKNIFPIPTDATPQSDALKYEEILKDIFPGESPDFDLVLLGLGENGHTASLFPGTEVLHEDLRWVKEVFIADHNADRITLTTPSINAANEIVFLVSGIKKAWVLHKILDGSEDIEKFPAQLIHPQKGELIWLVDHDAASMLK